MKNATMRLFSDDICQKQVAEGRVRVGHCSEFPIPAAVQSFSCQGI